MSQRISKRLLDIVDALPLKKGMRILEIGCGPGVAAREIPNRINNVYILGLDRSASAIKQAKRNSANEIKAGNIRFIQSKIETFDLPEDEQPFDLAFAIRVGALDGRHPEIEKQAFERIKKALKKNGKLFIDGGNPLIEINLITT